MSKLKLLIFHPALAPYRIDQFNAVSQLFDLEVVFIFDNIWNHKFDQSKLRSLLRFKYSYLLKGPDYKGRVFRFGMLAMIRRINPDIVLGYEYSFTTQYLLWLKSFGLIHQKIGSTVDDSLEISNHIQSKVRSAARKYAIKRLDYLVVLSNDVAMFYQESFNVTEGQVIVSPILQQPERLRSESCKLEAIAAGYTEKYQLRGKTVLLFVGRFIPEKGLVRFIKTISPTLQKQKDVILLLIGDGMEKKTIEVLLEKSGLTNQVLMPGRYEGTELYAWYLCASGFFLPSVFEPFGAVVNEALIFGLKVFCSKYAGASSLIQAEKGITFDPLSETETIKELQVFLQSLEAIENNDLGVRKSLMSDFESDLIKEWSKMY